MSKITPEKMGVLEEEVGRLTDLLQGYMRFKHRTVRDVERDLDWGRGTLNRIFAGRSELKLRHILEVAATLDLTPEDFFHMAYAVLPKGSTTLERVIAMIEQLGQRAGGRAWTAPVPEPPSAPALPPDLDLEAFAPLMEDLMRRLMAEREAEVTKKEEEAGKDEARTPKPRPRRASKPRKKKDDKSE